MSVPDLSLLAHASGLAQPATLAGVSAKLDWEKIEGQDSLEDIREGLNVVSLAPVPGATPGTMFELARMKAPWTDRTLVRFVREVRAAQPPGVLVDPAAVPALAEPALVPSPKIRDTGPDDPGFAVELLGDFDIGEDFFQQASEDFRWLVEIDATRDVVRYQVTPVSAYADDEPLARAYRFERTVPAEGRPRFVARVFTYPNASGRRGPLTSFVRSSTGIRVYLEGFRVLPYGESGDDWLAIDRDYRSGPRQYDLDLDPGAGDELKPDSKESLNATGNPGYVGAVFLTEAGAVGLRSLVNREGFVPNESFDILVDLVTTGIRLSVRVRRAVANAVKERERLAALEEALPKEEESTDVGEEAGTGRRPGVEGRPAEDNSGGSATASSPHEYQVGEPPRALADRIARALEDGQDAATLLRESLPRGHVSPGVQQVVSGFQVAMSELQRLRAQQPDLRVLASVGLQMGAFIHDINGLLGQARTVRELLEPLTYDRGLNQRQGAHVRRVARALDELAQALDRQSSYLTDVVSTDSRRRRRRIRLTDRLDLTRRLLAGQLAKREVALIVDLPPDLKTPPMFPSEVTVLLNNLLTNAVKSAGTPGRVLVNGGPLGVRGLAFMVANTGVRVDLDESERWFLPFETTTTSVDEVLGQGMGLGLPITRALVDDYRGSVRFVTPPDGYATAVHIELPDPQELR